MRRTTIGVAALASLALALTACGGDHDDAGDAGPTTAGPTTDPRHSPPS